MASRSASRLIATIVVVIVAAGLIAGAQRDDQAGPVDLIVHNGVVYTGAPVAQGSAAAVAQGFPGPRPGAGSPVSGQAVAVLGNQILRLGSDGEILALRQKTTTVVDARGGTVLPGFNDAAASACRSTRTSAPQRRAPRPPAAGPMAASRPEAGAWRSAATGPS
jgi:imidazolonepropionase-like amidohydrolase